MSQHDGSEFVRHVPCSACGSSDANSLYTDGHMYCHKCGAHVRGEGEPPTTAARKTAGLVEATYQALDKRRLSEESCRKWRYGVGTYAGQTVQVADYCDDEGNIVGQKVRFANKDFRFVGDASKATLYGQQLWRNGGKAVIVTEGEIDAISVSQIQDHKWPVVSIPTGANGARKALAKSLEWLESFESIVLMFDNDAPGQQAARECIDLFTPGKAKIATLPLKDANDMLKAGRGSEVVKAFWDAKVARPDGIIAGTELWDRLVAEPKAGSSQPFPFRRLQHMTRGMRRGELITFAAGTGVGKSEIVRQIYTYLQLEKDETLGLIHLEESPERSSLGMMGFYLKQKIHLDRDLVTPENFREAYEKTVGSGRVYLYEHFGSSDAENLFAKIRYFAKGCNCGTIVLDHISMVVSGIEDGDERRIIDNLMTRLATLAQELDVRLILITHLKKPMGTPHEEGGHVSLDDFRGSGSIKQLSHTAIGLERNQLDEAKKCYTHIVVLKCRFTGETGDAGYLFYDNTTGIVSESDGPPVFQDETIKPKENADF